MPKHEAPLQKLINPFSLPAQMNNLGVLIVAYVAQDLYTSSDCTDTTGLSFLYFIYYGSTIVCGGTLILTLLYMVGVLDFCINKIMPCGEVCLTLNTLTVFLAGLIYHFVATVYGLLQMYWARHSTCVAVEMFTRVTCTSYLLWVVVLVCYIVFKICWKNRSKKLQVVDQSYVQMK